MAELVPQQQVVVHPVQQRVSLELRVSEAARVEQEVGGENRGEDLFDVSEVAGQTVAADLLHQVLFPEKFRKKGIRGIEHLRKVWTCSRVHWFVLPTLIFSLVSTVFPL